MTPHSAYSAAKFAVKGFTEALIVDLRMNAPHVRCSVVMPGHIGTSIALNTSAVLGKHSAMELDDQEVSDIRERYLAFGLPVDNVPDDHIRQMVRQQQEDFRDKAPTSASAAAAIILDGVREQRWRILVGEDAKVLDAMVRQDPEQAYEVSFLEKLNQQGHMGLARNDEQTED
jgi:NAD(P)-dependent dehydrogenase (short-subunit alcohol dehydrogenase family)